MAEIYIYNDYTNLNKEVVEQYKLDLNFLYNDIPEFKEIIKEAHMNQLDKIINKAREIYEESKVHKDYVFDMDNINSFINLSVKLIESDLRELKIIN